MPGTRKKRVSKYWRSSTESELNRWSSTVSTHFERKRVSKENMPVVSVSDASMSPRSSLTTNVLPSSTLTTSSLTGADPRSWLHVEAGAVSEGRGGAAGRG